MSARENVLKDKSFELAVSVVNICQHLIDNKKQFVLSKQLLRSGTAVGSLIREAQNAESRADFIHKLGISQKECDESIYWLELLKETEFLTDSEFQELEKKATEILRMLRSSIITSKRNKQSETK